MGSGKVQTYLVGLCWLILWGVSLAGCQPAQKLPGAPAKQVGQRSMGEMRRVLMVLPPKNFRDEEFLNPQKVLQAAGFIVETATKGAPVAEGTGGTKVTVNVDLAKVDTAPYAAVVFVGGPGATVYLDDSQAHTLAQTFLRENKVVAAICLAPSILANAGILQGKRAAAFASEKANLEAQGAIYTSEAVSVSEKIVTANGPQAATAFGGKIRDLLQ